MDKSARLENLVRRHKTKIKREKLDEDIKEFAETTMNELLGWYGYGNAAKEEMKAGMFNCHSNSNSSGPDSPKSAEGCGWCGKQVEETTGITSASATFCSELCFSQSRRANFKKNKTCDWCRHVRHTVSYVDFQDGASQLQFCSDKCLNQYKMNIFCRETRAHLEMHPHLLSEGTDTGLITPDLWLKNCKSPHSRSPSPTPPPSKHDTESQPSPVPLITLAHPSKLLMSHVAPTNPETTKRQRKLSKKMRKRPSSTAICPVTKSPPEAPQDLRIRHSPSNSIDSSQFKEDSSKDNNNSIDEIDCRTPPISQVKTPKPPDSTSNLLPPVTVLVPYPILLPVPIPIPIPLPLSSFLKAYKLEELEAPSSQNELLDCTVPKIESSQKEESIESECNNESEDEEINVVTNFDEKPTRKRKKVAELKTKISIKSKKTLSV